MAMFRALSGSSGGGGSTTLSTKYNAKTTSYVNQWTGTSVSADNVRIVSMTGSIEVWALWSVDNGTVTQIAGGNDKNKLNVRVGSNGNFEVYNSNASGAMWFTAVEET